jgi:hypothetical protein
MKDANRTITPGRIGKRLRSVLVTGQIALAFVLLIGAGLMINSFARIVTKDLGADRTNLLTFAFLLPPADTIKVTSTYRGQPLGIVNPKPGMLIERLLDKLKSVRASSALPLRVQPHSLIGLLQYLFRSRGEQSNVE